jgi:UMP-CMP kinase 2
MSQHQRGICINLEGLDGVGKTTTVKRLADKLNAVIVKTPPDCISDIRELYGNSSNPYLRYHYYLMGNYIAGEEVEKILQSGKNVILDRFYCSTMAYMWGLKKMEFPGSFEWPPMLMKPDYIFHLSLDRDARIRRLSKRNDENSEERTIGQNEEIERDIIKYYLLLGCTDVHIEESDDIDEVCRKVISRTQK